MVLNCLLSSLWFQDTKETIPGLVQHVYKTLQSADCFQAIIALWCLSPDSNKQCVMEVRVQAKGGKLTNNIVGEVCNITHQCQLQQFAHISQVCTWSHAHAATRCKPGADIIWRSAKASAWLEVGQLPYEIFPQLIDRRVSIMQSLLMYLPSLQYTL